MMKTKYKIELHIYNNSEMDFDELTRLFHVEPGEFHRKGDLIRDNLFWKENCWSYATDYVSKPDLSDLLDSFIDSIKFDAEEARRYLKEHEMQAKLDVVLIIINGITPSYIISRKVLQFCHALDIEYIDNDIYSDFDDDFESDNTITIGSETYTRLRISQTDKIIHKQ